MHSNILEIGLDGTNDVDNLETRNMSNYTYMFIQAHHLYALQEQKMKAKMKQYIGKEKKKDYINRPRTGIQKGPLAAKTL